MIPEAEQHKAQVQNGLIKEEDQSNPEPPTYPLTQRMADYRVPGVSIAVIYNGQIEWAAGYGLRALGQADVVDTDTLFQAGSISKPVAALGALRMAEKGLLDLDADVNDYLNTWKVPSVEDQRTGKSWQPRVTIRQLLSHSAGTTVHGFLGYNADEAVPITAQILDGAKPANNDPVQVNTFPGAQFRYSGGGTTIVEQAMVDVTGTPFTELIREWVLEPLGMTRSTYQQPLPDVLHINAAHAHLYTGHHVSGNWYTMPEHAAAGLWTTPSDIARFALAVKQGLRGQHPVISQQVAEWMLTPEIQRGENSIGLGVFIGGKDENIYFGHGGANVGFRNDFLAYRDHDFGIVIMTNGDNGFDLLREVMRGAARIYGWPGYLPEADHFLDILPEGAAQFADSYELRSGYVLRIEQTSAGLQVIIPNQPPLTLHPRTDTEFSAHPLNATLTFVRADDGTISELKFKQNNETLSAKRLE